MTTLQPTEQKTVLFRDDEITAVIANGRVYVPLRTICNNLGVAWSAQRQRILRDPVLAEEMTPVIVTITGTGQQVEAQCLPLEFLNGWLFGINANRVAEDVRDDLIAYQKECYRVLYEATQDGRLTTDANTDIEALLSQDSPAAQAYQMAMAVVRMARQQLIMEARLDTAVTTLTEHGERLDQLEAAVGGKHVTEAQAAQISQAVKAVAMALGKKTKRNEFGGVYGELYRKFSVSSYKSIPQRRFNEVMAFLNEWLQSQISDNPF
ncbi:MAG: ORF6C domain-containing protein [Anaerolineaceae bacterium]|nr:ORF6C domain-containing protein [Anaerolineaceae bacterium]